MNSHKPDAFEMETQPQDTDTFDLSLNDANLHCIQTSKRKRKRRLKRTQNVCNKHDSQSERQDDVFIHSHVNINKLAEQNLPIQQFDIEEMKAFSPVIASLLFNEQQFEMEVQRRGMLIRKACSLLVKAESILANESTGQPSSLMPSLFFEPPSRIQRDQASSH